MGAAVALSAVNSTSAKITELWHTIGVLEDEPSMEALGYPPHFTLAIYEDVEVQPIESIVSELFSDVGQVRLTIDHIGFFDASPLVLWASSRDTSTLQRLHRCLHARIATKTCHEHYRPENWVPHCTLATRITEANVDQAKALVSDGISPFDVVFDNVDCISYPPVRVTRRLELRDD